MHIKRKRSWDISPSRISPESVYRSRRELLALAGSVGAGLLLSNRSAWADDEAKKKGKKAALYPAKRNPAYKVKAPLTKEEVAANYNNFYEFSTAKDQVAKLVENFVTKPWRIKIHGLVKKPLEIDVDELIRKLPLEERIYRFRCVEAWSMVVPWTGFSLAALLKLVEPTDKARYLRFVTFNKPKQAPGITQYNWYPWPYHEGLSLAEANNPLSLIATGIYGKPMPKQHGAPIRLIVPWKYGFKSIKSIVEIEVTAKQPPTFWNTITPGEYDFTANVDPKVPHPRWSQARERIIGTEEIRDTELYNGYAEQVAALYKS